MAVQYAPTKLRVPPGFQNLLEGLAREVLREQPDDIIVFAKKYFQKLIARREGESKEEAEKPQEKSEPEDRSEKTETDQIDPRENEAAAKIQAGFRGHKTREELKQNKEQTKAAVEIQSEKQEDEKKPESQETSQAQTEKPAEIADKIDINVEDPEVQDAALKIQASFRGHKAREEVKALRTQSSHTDSKGEEKASEPSEEGKAVDIDIDDPEVQEAALKIQASFRGYKARESVKSMKSQEGSEDAVPSVAVTGDTDEQTEAVAKDEPLESAGSAGDGQQEGAAPTLDGVGEQEATAPTLDGEGEQEATAPTLDGDGEQEVTIPTLDGEGEQNEGQTAEQGGSEQADQGQDGSEKMVTQENESSADQEPALEETVETKQDG